MPPAGSIRAALARGALFATLTLASAPAGARAAPSLVFDAETCDLGNVVQGEQPSCDFAYGNGGAAAVRILAVEPTCGCTTALLSSARLAPGERASLRVVFDSENFTGEIVKEIEVRSDDPERPRLTLRLRARVEPEIEFEPATLDIDRVRAGEVRRYEIAVTNRRPEAVRVLSLESEPSSYRCALPAWSDTAQPLVLESWDRVVLEVRFTAPPALTMAVPGACTLQIDGPRKRLFRFKLLALPAP